MIPYFEQPRLSVGPLTIYGFGVLVGIAVLVSAEIVRRRAHARNLSGLLAQRLTSRIVIAGFIGAHLVDRLVYFPSETLADPLSLLKPWAGLSSFGGFWGATVAAIIFQRRHRIPALWPYLDVIAYAFPPGWIIGRLGCFIAFDHPGSPTRFFLGQRYSDGVVRHNLGLEEALYTVVIAVVFVALGRRARRPGFFVAWLAVLYSPFRFALDFLRKIDVRYFGLTPGQYGAIVVFIVGAVLAARLSRSAPPRPAGAAAPP